ncbi:MAG: hypothetical protein AAGA30_05060, partial [Planctomycetota bacterium]
MKSLIREQQKDFIVAKQAIPLFIALIVSTGLALAETNENIPSDANIIELGDSAKKIATWSRIGGASYAIQKNGLWHVRENVDYRIRLQFEEFDPIVATPAIPRMLEAQAKQQRAANVEQVFIVQFVTQPLEEYRQGLESLGAKVHKYLPNHSYLVRMNDIQRQLVNELPFVRWIGPFEAAYKLDRTLQGFLANDNNFLTRFNIMVHQRGPQDKQSVARTIIQLGGKVHAAIDEGFRMEATLNREQVLAIAGLTEVAWIDLWSEPEVDMDKAREIGGVNFIETVAGFTGQGVRGEVMDNNLFNAHNDFQSTPPIFHGNRAGVDDHGTGTYGIVFGDGTVNELGRGILPSAQGIFADYGQLNNR